MDKRKPTAKKNKSQISQQHALTVTPELEEGPYYKANSPEKQRLYEKGIPGEKLTLTGQVIDTQGKRIAHAWMDFWQADGNGKYDNAGYILRGHQYTDNSGKYLVETVQPGSYPGRTPHIHVKVRVKDDSPVFTTQLFLPGLASNKTDFLYRNDLLIEMKDEPEGKRGVFNFVLARQ